MTHHRLISSQTPWNTFCQPTSSPWRWKLPISLGRQTMFIDYQLDSTKKSNTPPSHDHLPSPSAGPPPLPRSLQENALVYIAGYLCHKVLGKGALTEWSKPTADSLQRYGGARQWHWFTSSPTHAFISVNCWWLFQNLLSLYTPHRWSQHSHQGQHSIPHHPCTSEFL